MEKYTPNPTQKQIVLDTLIESRTIAGKNWKEYRLVERDFQDNIFNI